MDEKIDNSRVHRIRMICPSCGRPSETTGFLKQHKRLKCGVCLIERKNVVELKVVSYEAL